MSEALAVCEQEAPKGLMRSATSPGEMVGIINHVHAVIKDAMNEDINGDYAVIPGTGEKKTLLKPGAEKLLLAFNLTGITRKPEVRELGNGHREYIVETEIRNIFTNNLHAIGLGSCSTLESKYRYRGAAGRECPECHAVACKPSKKEWGGGYYCDGKAGGCNARFKADSEQSKALDTAPAIRQENPDPADTWNTVLKMASKRSLIDGTLRATATSAMFTQDMDDIMQQPKPEPETVQQQPQRKAAAPAKAPAVEVSPADLIRKTIIKEQARLNVPGSALKSYSADVLGGKAWAAMSQDEAQGMLEWLVASYDSTPRSREPGEEG